MADFCITAIRLSSNGEHIEDVHVREEQETSISPPRVVARAFVADLIRLNKATFITRVKNANGNWSVGANIHVIDEQYLSTDRNSSKRDNLGNLPKFL